MARTPIARVEKNSNHSNKIMQSKGDVALEAICYIIFSICALLCIYPFYYILINTISANDLSAKGIINFIPRGIHFKNYTSALSIDGLFQAAKISIGRIVIGASLTVMTSAFLGFMFTQEKMWHRRLWYRLIVATMYFNAGIIPWYLTMKNLGLTNNFWGYIFHTMITPFSIILTKTFVESVPNVLQEAAEIDGASILKIFFMIMLPIIKPILATVAIFAAVTQWNSFQDTLLLVSDTKLYSLQFVLYQYLNQASSLSSLAKQATGTASLAASVATQATAESVRMTVTILVVIPIVLVYPIFQRYFTKGIMIGAVKG